MWRDPDIGVVIWFALTIPVYELGRLALGIPGGGYHDNKGYTKGNYEGAEGRGNELARYHCYVLSLIYGALSFIVT